MSRYERCIESLNLIQRTSLEKMEPITSDDLVSFIID